MEENKEEIEKQNIELDEPVVPQTMGNKNYNQDGNPKKGKKGLVIALIVIILLIAAALVYFLLFTKNEKKNENKEEVTPTPSVTPQETEEPKNIEVPAGDYELTVYKNKETGELSALNEKNEYTIEAFKIKVNTKNARVIDAHSESKNYLLYDDDGLYIYDHKTKKSQKVDVENTYKEYLLYFNSDDSKVIGIGYLDNNDKYGYYNVSKGIKLYNLKYKIESIWGASQINDHYLSLVSGATVYLLSADSETVKLSYKDPEADETTFYFYSNVCEEDKCIYILGTGADIFEYVKLYNSDFKLFYDVGENSGIDEYLLSFDKYLYFAEGNYETGFNKLLKYSYNGDLVATYTDYPNIQMVSKKYVVYVDKDDNLTVANIENHSESKVLTKMQKHWSIDTLDSGHYDRETLDIMDEKNKKEGFYVIVEYGYDDEGNNIKDSKGYYGMEYCYTPDKQVVEYPIKEERGGRAKPVLYLYPEKETYVKVTFAHPEYLTTTYPKYTSSWNVTAKPNGDLTDKDGKYYYALYWDEKRYSEVDFKEGFYVEGKDAISFLEEKLNYIGLNDKERNEFIMYWLPIMENNKKNLVYFELTNERELANKLIIDPKPDSLLRVSIHIKKVNNKVSIKEQKLESFNRVGFTAVEWGGMTY